MLTVLLLTACPKTVPPRELEKIASVEEAMRDADAAWAQRPDATAVRKALSLYQSAAAGDPARIDGNVAVVRAVGWLLEHGAKEDRKELADEAVAAGEQCQQRTPDAPLCNYWQAVAMGLRIREHKLTDAVAMGLRIREHKLTAITGLSRVIELLKKASAQDPSLDEGGPFRVLALLLVRAPPWPAGPGNSDDALAAAQQAVAHGPDHPLNQLVLAESLEATGETEGAKAAYRKAAQLGRTGKDPDGADWAAQAEAALAKL